MHKLKLMQMLNNTSQIPIHYLAADTFDSDNNFRVYNFEGNIPDRAELLSPHRKNHYLIAFVRRAETRQWIDMQPYILKNNTIYFTGPNQVIVKEGLEQLWSTGIAFTEEFLSLQENATLSKLPVIQNPENGHELMLNETDINFIEDLLAKINTEYQSKGEWKQRMLGSYLSLLLTYLSRLYTEQYKPSGMSSNKHLLKKFYSKVNECFHTQHEVSDYAALMQVSASHLSEMVKIQSGKPAIKHIHDRLIMETRRLLFHTDKSIKEISFDLGFTDASYFNRFFKRETGITPTEYRTNARKMYHNYH